MSRFHTPMNTMHIGRRALVAGSGSALLLVAAEAGPAKAEELDGSLIAMCREFHEGRGDIAQLEQIEEALPLDHPRAKQAAEGVRRLVDRAWGLREGIAATPARTPEGLLEKARIALWEASLEDTNAGSDMGVAASLARDVLGRAGA